MKNELPTTLVGWLRKYASDHAKTHCDYGPCVYCRNMHDAANKLEAVDPDKK